MSFFAKSTIEKIPPFRASMLTKGQELPIFTLSKKKGVRPKPISKLDSLEVVGYT